MVKVISISQGTAESAHFGSKFFSLREIPILKWGTIRENHCLTRLSPFDVRNFFSILSKLLMLFFFLFVVVVVFVFFQINYVL